VTNPDDGSPEREAVERYFAAINRRDVAAIVADLPRIASGPGRAAAK